MNPANRWKDRWLIFTVSSFIFVYKTNRKRPGIAHFFKKRGFIFFNKKIVKSSIKTQVDFNEKSVDGRSAGLLGLESSTMRRLVLGHIQCDQVWRFLNFLVTEVVQILW